MKKTMAWILAILMVWSLTACGGGASCTDLEVSCSSVTFTAAGDSKGLEVRKIPADAQEQISFASSNEAVVTVNERGLLTAVGEGSATITVTCGDVSRFCEVLCRFDGTVSDDTTDPVPPATELRPTDPQPTESVCSDCGGKGTCANCGGDPVCKTCGGEPICKQCRNNNPGFCPVCGGEKGQECPVCYGRWECKECDADGVCAKCGGSKICATCNGSERVPCTTCDDDGEPDGKCIVCDGEGYLESLRDRRKCVSCDGSGNCSRCDGTKARECYCNKGRCGTCRGTGECVECDGDGSTCKYCEKGFRACEFCSGSGICGGCMGEPTCKTCGGEGLICKECDNGKCRTCGGKNAPQPPDPQPTDPPAPQPTDSPVPPWPTEGTKCPTCNGEEFCPYCNSGVCPRENCLFGKVDCSNCEAGQCNSCGGTGINWITDKKCSTCGGDKECRSCGGEGYKDCTYCNDGDCTKCGGNGWCPTCGGNGYI